MFYSQNVDNIKLVILTLDGGLLDLNRLRYNYFKRTCETYHKTITKDQFSFMLGSMKTMYDKSPIQDVLSNKEFNRIVEKDLFEYVKLKPNIKREGVDEFVQYCLQKDIKIAVYTTHKSKRAIQYLQLTDLYNKIDFLIGGDSKLPPLPHKDVLTVICQQMNVDPQHTLVVANFESMIEAALNLYANVIYMPDLVPANDTIKACVYKVVKNYLEIMNVFLFSKYDSMELFSPILGMNADMDRDTLYKTKNKLLNKYKNDEQLIALVNRAYDYFVDLLNKQEISEKFSHKQKIFFRFDDENDINLQKAEKVDTDGNTADDNENKRVHLFRNVNENNVSNSDTFILSGATSYDPKRMNELMDIINGDAKASNSEKKQVKEQIEEKETDNDEENKILTATVNILFNFLLSMIIVLVAIMFYLLFTDYLNGSSVLAQIINGIYDVYISMVNGLFGIVFNGLSAVLYFIPTYETFVYKNTLLSSMAALSLLSVFFNFICISVIRLLVSQREKKKIA